MENSQQTTFTGKRYFVSLPDTIRDDRGLPVPDIEITRMDFFVTGDRTTVNKLGMNVMGKTIVAEGKTVKNFDLAGALNWCRANGWTVRTWPGGARAWRYGLEPVRDSRQIRNLRDELNFHPRPELEGQGVALDLRYDL